MTDQHPAQAWPYVPRPRLAHHPATGEQADAGTAETGGTRLDIGAMSARGAVAEPTAPLRAVPPPVVNPIGTHRGVPRDIPRSDRLAAGTFSAEPERLEAADFISQVMADQHELNLAHQAAMRPRLRKALKWGPAKPPSLREEAEARVRVAQREAERKLAHERRMDRAEIVRAWLGVACLIVVFLLLIGMATVGVLIFTGYFSWMPVHVVGS